MENNNDNLINVRARPGRPKLALGPDELAAKRLQQREYHRKYYADHKAALSAYNLANHSTLYLLTSNTADQLPVFRSFPVVLLTTTCNLDPSPDVCNGMY